MSQGTVRRFALLFAFAVLVPACGGGGGGGGAPPAPPPSWLVMVYIAADNNLDKLVSFDLNLMEAAAASPYVTTVVQVDTQNVPINGSTTAKRIRIQSEGTFNNTLISPTLPGQDLGEINTASPTAVQNFVSWATSTYPADRKILVLWDHGGQWNGYGEDSTSGAGAMNFATLKTMFLNIQSATGIAKFDIIGFDACLMAAAEMDQLLAPFATFRVASCEIENGSWNYADSLNALAANPSMSVAAYAQGICDSFIALKNALGITNQTLSVADLSTTASLVTAINAFAVSLSNNLGTQLLTSIAPSRRLTAEYGKTSQDQSGFFVDLEQFAALVATSTSVPSLAAAANNVVAAVDAHIDYRVQGSKAPNHQGISIYFPNCAGCDPAGPNYPNTDLAITTQWDEFLAAYQAALAVDTTPPGVTINSPAPGTSVSPASPVTVNFTLTGSDIADVTGLVGTTVAPDQWFIFGEIEYGALFAGSWNVTWNARAFTIWDGVAANSNWIGAFSAAAGTSIYISVMRHIPLVGPPQDVLAFLDLNWTSGTGTLFGIFEVTTSGTLATVQAQQGDSLRVQYPTLNTVTGDITYSLSPTNFVIPAGGLSSMTISHSALPSGSHEFLIMAEDYAENVSADGVSLTVP